MIIFKILNVLKCLKTQFKNPLHNFVKKESIGRTIFVQIAPYFNHK
jgi:hypothetical protein